MRRERFPKELPKRRLLRHSAVTKETTTRPYPHETRGLELFSLVRIIVRGQPGINFDYPYHAIRTLRGVNSAYIMRTEMEIKAVRMPKRNKYGEVEGQYGILCSCRMTSSAYPPGWLPGLATSTPWSCARASPTCSRWWTLPPSDPCTST